MTRHEQRSGQAAAQSTEAQRLAGLVLVRIAAGSGVEAEVGRDLLPLVLSRSTPEIWRIEFGRFVTALVAGGLIVRDGATLVATKTGRTAAAEFIGAPRSFPASWPAARDKSLLALALGLERASPRLQKLLKKADGLRALIVMGHWQLTIKGAPSPSRLRAALAVKALERAFGNQVRDGLGDKSSLPAKAGRLLAGQLSASPRDFGTDARLVATLAAEVVGTTRSDLKTLELAVLRRYIGGGSASHAVAPRRTRRKADRRRLPPSASSVPTDSPPSHASDRPTTAAGVAEQQSSPAPNVAPSPRPAPVVPVAPGLVDRPDPERFAGAVNAATDAVAEGWAGNRKAFISHVWHALGRRHPEWALTEIEFKCMLAEAHRTGLVVLANADLKDKRLLKELQDSAVIYKNAVWHYVRAPE